MYSGLILQPGVVIRGGRPVIQIWGRLDSGEPFLVEDDRFRPYFFVRERDADMVDGGVHGVTPELKRCELRNLAGEPVARVTVGVPGEVPPLRDRLEERGVPTYEADIRFPYRYLMDHALHSQIAIDGKPTKRPGGHLHFVNPTLTSSECTVIPTHLSLDLETMPDASQIFSAALFGCGAEEVHLVTQQEVPGAIGWPDEKSMLIAMTARIRELDPDLLIGWNVVDFDLRVIVARCQALGISSRDASLGRVPGPIDFQSDRSFTRQSRAKITGRMVLDGIPMVRDAMRLPDYRLGTVAHAVLGRGKLIDEEAPDPGAEILRMYREEPAALVAYNLEDARLVTEILEHEGLLTLALERSLLSGMQLDRVGASIASFDLLYLPELRRYGHVAPSVVIDRMHAPVSGGAVLTPMPGLVPDVAVYDFKSLYPSLIRTFNIDPLAMARAEFEPAGAAIVAPNGARLSRSDAILPRILERFMQRREAAKARGDRHADQAIKIMMNSMFGVFASTACRFFSADLANAITRFGQQTLAWTCEAFEQEGVAVLYGDTDSVFVRLAESDGGPAEARALAEHLRERVAAAVEARIKRDYAVESKLDLELEKIFARFFLPRVRGGHGGSKKRYAGWLSEADAKGGDRLEIVGLESVRRDWPAIAGRMQRGMLERLFRDEEIMPFVRDIIEQLRVGVLDRELVYVKRIRKGSLDSYTASSPPHIQAARKLEARTGQPVQGIIRYVITASGPHPLQPGEPIPGDVDHPHYVERVLRPVADSILAEVGASFGEALGEPQQLELL
jgi:DNA polymerase-2